MDEAIDYNALSWVRHELDETLKLARVQLEEFAEDTGNVALLQKCAAQLHEALGPLQMVGIKGAVLLTSEMEEVVADLLQDTVEEKETALELLMQAFLQLPDYLSSIRSGKKDNPAVLLPVINSLRATRGVQALQKTAVFSPNLSIRVPVSVFDVRANREKQDIPAMARAARVRFQSGLLAWYRGSDDESGLQALIDVLVHLQKSAMSEPAARVWWIGAGVAEALRDGGLKETTEMKQLFGQLDRQIKRLLDAGEKVFSDLLTDELVKNLLYCISQCRRTSGRIDEIRSTYGLIEIEVDDEAGSTESKGSIIFNDDLLQTVAVTVRSDIENIKDQLDTYTRSVNSDVPDLLPVADGLHILGNTLDMICKEDLSKTVFEHELHVRDLLAGCNDPADPVFTAIANTLIAIEDALDDVAANDSENAALHQGVEAVAREVIANMSRAKEVLHEFLKQPDNPDSLDGVPELLEQMNGGLQLINQDRAAIVTQKIRQFVLQELMDGQKTFDDTQLDTLADAMCSIEFHVEELCENRNDTGAALDIAEQSMNQLGYPCPVMKKTGCDDSPATAQECMPSGQAGDPGEMIAETAGPGSAEIMENSPDITAMQVIDPGVDEEILSIFIEEADDELVKLRALVPAWANCPTLEDYLVDAQRSFHTLKGSGRMVGALALGELAWAFESLVNRIIEGAVTPHDDIRALIARSLDALLWLLEQVKGNSVEATLDVNHMAHCALVFCDPDGVPEVLSAEVDDDLDVITEITGAEETDAEQKAPVDFPVLSADADPEIVGIFLDEAAEELANVSEAIPEWIRHPDNDDALTTIRRSMHTLKGSGRMAGAMQIGEFSWAIEDLLNRVIDGVINATDQVFVLFGQVPEALSQLITQVQDGRTPTVDFRTMMQHACALSRGELVEFVETAPEAAVAGNPEPDIEVTGMVNADITAGVNELADASDGADADDVVLLDIYRNECLDLLQAIERYLAESDEPRVVDESLYRAVHTLSGISESAGIVSISCLAADLNSYIDEVFHLQQVLPSEALKVLQDCSLEFRQLVEKLPDQGFDETFQAALRERIAVQAMEVPEAAPEAEYVSGDETAVEQSDALTDAVDTAPAASDEDPYASMDQELYEIFIEEASEIIDNSELVLRAWSEERDNHEHMAEFQRYLHTLKGSARMMDIPAIGDLAHVLESLITRVADGLVASTDDLFTLLHESHDRLSEMLENVKSRRHPGEADNLELSLKTMAQEEAGCAENTATEAITEVVPEEISGPEDRHEAGIADEPETNVAENQEPDVLLEAETADAAGPVAGDADEAVVESVAELPANADTAPADNDREEMVPDAAAGTAPASEYVTETDLPEDVSTEAVKTDDIEVVTQTAKPVAQAPAVRKAATVPGKAKARRATKIRSEQVRVQSELLDGMVNHVGEISIYRTRMENQVSDFRFNLTELDQTITRLRDQLRQLEMETEAQILFRYEQEASTNHQDFDPLEMDRYSNLQQTSRSLIESISDLRSLHELMEATTREAETLLLQQSRVSTDLQEGLMHTRMIPFAGLGTRLRRIVRQSAKQLGKKVELNLVGADGEMDRTVIERIIAPLEHMLRNAIAHGIETPEQRKESGKQETGSITISFDREGPEIVLLIEDDGAGIDVEAVRARAIERDLILADSQLPDNDVMQFILQTGFSTATEVTQISGRGVGMDVVNSEVKQLGGSLHIESTTGLGTLFTVRLPYTLAINQALLVVAGEQTFCVPLGIVEGVVRASPEELIGSYSTEQCVYEYAGNDYQLRHLGTVLGTGDMDLGRSQGQVPVLLIRIGEKRIAFQIESLKGSREIVIKPVGAQLSTVDCVSGATILGNGSVVMILDMAAVSRINTRVQSIDLPTRRSMEGRLVVMVVDDSITVRKVTTRLLERNGFSVLTAKDGIDAMGQLQETVPDMMLLDIEMPRMDGFELATHMRNDDRFKHVPIIMITSRTGDKHRERARQIGVNNYLGKPYQENDLLDSIQHIIGATEAGAVA